MKLKDIAKLCKARGIITLTPVGGTQWIGDLGAAFPALGMPFMDEETVGVCLDFDEKTREKVKVCNIPPDELRARRICRGRQRAYERAAQVPLLRQDSRRMEHGGRRCSIP